MQVLAARMRMLKEYHAEGEEQKKLGDQWEAEDLKFLPATLAALEDSRCTNVNQILDARTLDEIKSLKEAALRSIGAVKNLRLSVGFSVKEIKKAMDSARIREEKQKAAKENQDIKAAEKKRIADAKARSLYERGGVSSMSHMFENKHCARNTNPRIK